MRSNKLLINKTHEPNATFSGKMVRKEELKHLVNQMQQAKMLDGLTKWLGVGGVIDALTLEMQWKIWSTDSYSVWLDRLLLDWNNCYTSKKKKKKEEKYCNTTKINIIEYMIRFIQVAKEQTMPSMLKTLSW